MNEPPLLSERTHRFWTHDREEVNPTRFSGKVWFFLLSISHLTAWLAEHSWEYLRLAMDYGIWERISCAWLRIGNRSLSVTASMLTTFWISYPLNHILQSLVRVSLFSMLKTIGLENILCSLYMGDFMCTCIDGTVRKIL